VKKLQAVAEITNGKYIYLTTLSCRILYMHSLCIYLIV